MRTGTRLPNRAQPLVAAFVLATFLWTLVLSVSPDLHSRIHRDANTTEHTCAITFVSSGTVEHSTPAPQVGPPVSVAQFSKIAALNPLWVPSPFLNARIFEHAPPSHS